MIDKLLNISFKVGVLLGGAVLLIYCWRIGYFPSDVTVGDGLLFIILAISFGGVYTFFVSCITNLGMWPISLYKNLKAWLPSLYQKFRRGKGRVAKATMGWPELDSIIFALLGIILILGFGWGEYRVLLSLTFTSIFCAILWDLYLRIEKLARSMIQVSEASNVDNQYAKKMLNKKYTVLVALFILPLAMGGVTGKIFDGTMRIANIRTDSVSIHLKGEYAILAEDAGVKTRESTLGNEFKFLDNANVLFEGFGRNVVIEVAGDKNKKIKLVVPRDHLHIVNS